MIQPISGSFTADTPGIIEVTGLPFLPVVGFLSASETRQATDNTNARMAIGTFTEGHQTCDSLLSSKWGWWCRAKRGADNNCLLVLKAGSPTVQSAVKLNFLEWTTNGTTYGAKFQVIDGDVNFQIAATFLG